MNSPFWHYNSLFDAQSLIRAHAAPELSAVPNRFVNYFGVIIDPKFFPTILGERAGEVERETIPANWHADIAEFGAALRAVELAQGSFTMVELGCGWGCWMNITGAAARRCGLTVSLIGVEGDEDHVGFARQALTENGFAAEEYRIHRGIASANAGEALFPSQEGGHWGLSPMFNATPEQRAEVLATGHYHALPMVPLSGLAADHQRIDLLHMDIQGGEHDLIAEALDFLRENVAYLVIGTHSRAIEGKIWALLEDAGWLLEMERPAIFMNHGDKLTISVDGVQGWRNLALLPQ
jgi:FkbM family methyltransferase